VYDRDKDIAKVVARIKIGKVKNIIGKDINYENLAIERVAFATSTPGSDGALKALRAAELDAYKQLAKKILGFKLKSNTSVKDFLLTSDHVQTKLLAAIWGARLEGYRWDGDGDAYVKLSMKVDEVEDIMGQKIHYDDYDILVEGTGASVSDFNPAAFETSASTEPTEHHALIQVREESLDIPLGHGSARTETIEDKKPSGGARASEY
jgi:hypothetical protein